MSLSSVGKTPQDKATSLSVEEFRDMIARSNLLQAAELDRVDSIIRQLASRGAVDMKALAKQLVAAGLLTQWQCEKLLEKRHRGFFLGKYKFVGHLGSGGMSSVYLAEHMLMQRLVALKVLPRDCADDELFLARFRMEARAAGGLDHPNIVRSYDSDFADNVHFIVMEYVVGRDLQRVVTEDGPLDYSLAANYIAQAAAGLAHAHGAGVVHRDVKPGNLIVNEAGVVKLLDLGLAKALNDGSASLTVAHESVLGTVDYLAPEQALNSHCVDPRADIYSLGCTFYYLLTGRPPFDTGTAAQRLLMHQTQWPPSIQLTRPDAPADLIAICRRMMSKRPDERYQSGHDVVEAINQWLGSQSNVGLGSENSLRSMVDTLPPGSDTQIGRDDDLLAPLPDDERSQETTAKQEPVAKPSVRPVPTVTPSESNPQLEAYSDSLFDELTLPTEIEASYSPRSAPLPRNEQLWLRMAVVAAVLVFLGLAFMVIQFFYL